MGNLNKKIQDNKDKEELTKLSGKKPKHRCPVCHRFTLMFIQNNGTTKDCYWCYHLTRSRLAAKAESIAKMRNQTMKKEGDDTNE